MIFLKRQRLIFWLLKAYFKKWRKTIFISFIVGLAVFFILRFGVNYFIPLIPFTQKQTIGLTGAYTTDNLPQVITTKLSSGLTGIDENQEVKPNIASSWDIKNDGKTYIFHLRDDVYFNNGSKLTSDDINYNFIDVKVDRPNKNTIIFNLKNKYSPFLVTVSKPIFKNGLVGTGEYRVSLIDLNGNFVQSISIISTKASNKELVFQFYPTEESLKTAFMLGEVSQAIGIKDLNFKGKSMLYLPNANIHKRINYSQLVTLFYNVDDKNLSDKRLRAALSYVVPDTLTQGERNYGPFTPTSWVARNGLTTYSLDPDHAKLLLKDSLNSSQSSKLIIELKTLPQYEDVAKLVVKQFSELGLKFKITVVQSLPVNFQMFLGDFNVPKDPDQYMLWHSAQTDNISNYKNLRIDKLLEDGRQIYDLNERIKIYEDFQKYLLDDPPAIFLYFPYVYDITRK
jgi:peptide/nickel transport system substrate-binding protein